MRNGFFIVLVVSVGLVLSLQHNVRPETAIRNIGLNGATLGALNGSTLVAKTGASNTTNSAKTGKALGNISMVDACVCTCGIDGNSCVADCGSCVFLDCYNCVTNCCRNARKK